MQDSPGQRDGQSNATAIDHVVRSSYRSAPAESSNGLSMRGLLGAQVLSLDAGSAGSLELASSRQ